MAEKLSPKQERFVNEYLVDLNATQAYKRAGYKATSDVVAASNAQKLLGNYKVAAAIQKAQQKRSHRTEITADAVLHELGRLGFANMMDYITVQPDGTAFVDLTRLTREQAAAIQEIQTEEVIEGTGDKARNIRKVKLKLHNKEGALEKIGKHLGMFIEKHEVTGKDGGPIVITDPRDELLRRMARLAAGGDAGEADPGDVAG